MSKDKPALIVKNKSASRNYVLGDSFQAGIVLEGWEVKSLRNGKIDVKNSYVTFKNDEAWLLGVKIDPPGSLKDFDIDPLRTRKLLLKKREISKLWRSPSFANLSIFFINGPFVSTIKFLETLASKVKLDIASMESLE